MNADYVDKKQDVIGGTNAITSALPWAGFLPIGVICVLCG